MISTKMNTKTWSDTPTRDNSRTEQPLTDDQKKMMGGQDLSTVLNKAADPNYVAASKKVHET